MPNFLDRIIGRDTATRAQIVGENGGAASLGTVNPAGLMSGSAFRRNADVAALRATANEALTVSAVAARCVNLFVQAAANRPLEIVTSAGEPVDHYLEKLFNRTPNASQSAIAFWTEFWNLMQLRGEAFIILDRGPSRIGDVRSAHVHFGNVKVKVTAPTAYAPHGEIAGFQVPVGSKFETLIPEEVVWARYPDPVSPWGAMAPITAALNAIGMTRAATEWQAGQLANGGNPTGIVYVGDPQTQEAFDMAVEDANAALTGSSNSGRLAVYAGATKPEFIRTSFTAAEVGFLDTINASNGDIALALGVPLDLVGGQRTYANVDASWRIFWQDTVLPRMAIVASEIDRQLLAGTDYRAGFDVDDVAALQEGQDAVSARAIAAVQSDILLIDEARELLGFDPLPNGAGQTVLSALQAANAPAATTVDPNTAPTRSAVRLVDALEIAGVHNDTESTPNALKSAPVASEGQADIIDVRGITADTAEKALDRLSAAAERAVKRLSDAQRRDALKRLNRNRRSDTTAPDANTVFSPAAWAERAYEFLLPALYAAFDEGAAGTARALGVDVNIDSWIADAVDARAQVLADQVNQTTAKVLSDRLAAAAIADQVTVSQFADVIETVFADLSGYRAETIARTEMIGAYNGSSRQIAVESGVVHAREWSSSGRLHAREDHAALNGTRTQGLDDPWPNGLMYPGDPSGDPSQTINCGCVELYVTDYTTGGN